MQPHNFQKYFAKKPEDLQSFLLKFCLLIEKNDFIAFYGELGTGKTFSIKIIAEYFNVSDIVTSPSFNIINVYTGDVPIYHLDLYRIKSSVELDAIDWASIISSKGLKLVEWAENAENYLPEPRWDIFLYHSDDRGRIIKVEKIK